MSGTREAHAGKTQRDAEDLAADPTSVARLIGLQLLTAAPRTRAQLAQAMRKRGVPDDAATEVLDRFGEVGLIDDAAFAASWVSSRQAGRGLAPRALANELRQRGVAEPAIADALEVIGDDDIEASARRLATRRMAATRGLPATVRGRRLVAMLSRKGYPGGLAARVVREVLAADVRVGDSPFDEVPADEVPADEAPADDLLGLLGGDG